MKKTKLFFALGGILLASGIASTQTFASDGDVTLICKGSGSIKCDSRNVSQRIEVEEEVEESFN